MINKRIAVIVSTCLGAGYFPVMPGTVGTFLAALLYIILPATIFATVAGNAIFLAVILLISIAVIPLVSQSEKILGHDNGKIVIDEFLGYLLATAYLPKSLITALTVFIFFRIFDILKPEPVNMLQKLPGGWGVMADDLMAGIYANICGQIIFKLLIKS